MAWQQKSLGLPAFRKLLATATTIRWFNIILKHEIYGLEKRPLILQEIENRYKRKPNFSFYEPLYLLLPMKINV